MNHAQNAVAGATLLSIAFMLGAALIFVTLFRKLGLGATLGYIVGGARSGLSLARSPTRTSCAFPRVHCLCCFLLFELPHPLWRLRKDIFGLADPGGCAMA